MNGLGELLEKLLEEMVVEDQPEHWKDARFINQRKIQIDKRGSIGERFFLIALTMLYPRRHRYMENSRGSNNNNNEQNPRGGNMVYSKYTNNKQNNTRRLSTRKPRHNQG